MKKVLRYHLPFPRKKFRWIIGESEENAKDFELNLYDGKNKFEKR